MNTAQRIYGVRELLDHHPAVCLVMGPNRRGQFAAAVVRAYEAELARSPTEKPDVELIKARVKQDAELHGIIPAFILVAVFGWIIHKILDWLWDNR